MVINFCFSICKCILVSKTLPDLFFIDIFACHLAVEFLCRVNHGFKGPDIGVYTLYWVCQSGESGLQSFS